MKKKLAIFTILVLVVELFLGSKKSFSSSTTSNPLVPVFTASEQAAALHKDLENRCRDLATKAKILAQRGASYQANSFQYGANQVIQGASNLPNVIKNIRSTMTTLQVEMRKTGLFAAFYTKFKIWSTEFRKVKEQDDDLQTALQSLQNLPSSPQQAAPLFEKPAELLNNLSASAKQLHVDFQVMANILEIFQQVPATLVAAPPGRVLGETWLEHEERTGEWGIADPLHPTSNFSAHSIYAIRDHNPNHVVWADEANILDFLLGRVKGQDYPYKNSADVPYCMRCHNRRVGKHNFTWCRPTNSQTMIDACNVLEKTAH
jgi:hypothetical protein